jgi:acetyltransferase-like isoleucine patch superfamily enzyme
VSTALKRLRGPVQAAVIWTGYRGGPRLMSMLRKWWVIARNPQVRFEISEPAHFGPGFGIHAPYGGTLRIGPAVEFRRGFRLELAEGYSEVSIGTGTAFTYDVLIQCGRRIEIGERCLFGQATTIVDGDHRFGDPERPIAEQGYDLRPISIADGVWTGAKCTIIAGIGAGTVVGANSVVTRELPANVVAVGAPARAIDYFGPPGGEPPELGASSSASSQAERKSGASS